MTLIAVCFAFLVVSLAASRLAYSTFLSPPVSYFLVYLVTTTVFLLLTKFGVLGLDGISNATSALLYLSWGAFLLGCFLEPLTIIRAWRPHKPTVGDLRRLIPWAWFVGCLGLVGAVALTLLIASRFGNPLTSTEAVRNQLSGPNATGDQFSINPAISILLYANYTAIVDWIILAVFLDHRYWRHAVAWGLLMLFLGHSMGTGGMIFMTCTCFGSTYLLCTLHRQKRLSYRHVVAFALAIVIVIGAMTLEAHLRSANPGNALGDTTVLYDGLYTGATIAALQDSVDHPPTSPFPGFYTFSTPYKFLNMASRLVLNTELYKSNEGNHRFDIHLVIGEQFYNSCPSMGWWYGDLGLGGAVGLSFFMGWYSSWIFRRAVRSGNILALEIGALSWVFLLLTYREGFFDDPWMLTWVIAVVLRQAFLPKLTFGRSPARQVVAA